MKIMMAKKLLPEILPGEILLMDFRKPMGVSANQLAREIDVSPRRITHIVKKGRPITMDTALRLALYCGMSTEFWVSLQRFTNCGLRNAILIQAWRRSCDRCGPDARS